MIQRSLTLAPTALVPLALPAHAHPAGHAHMTWLELAQHYAEPDHLAFLALTVLVGWLAFRWGRRLEARAQRAAGKRERGRS